MSSKRTQSKKLIRSALREQEEERNLDRLEVEKWLEDEKRLDAFEVDPEDYLDEPQPDLDAEEYYCDDDYFGWD